MSCWGGKAVLRFGNLIYGNLPLAGKFPWITQFSDKMNGMHLSPLPRYKTSVDVFGDFLAYLFQWPDFVAPRQTQHRRSPKERDGAPDSIDYITKHFEETTKRLFRDKKDMRPIETPYSNQPRNIPGDWCY
ncbi:hypothetical protein M405DRAFT_836978 [Rhizopogon salebrosus TDB-379]|nr:hypothetical protein M405DRAFT_836978 [Rhizopogon salebrosus TDB-379]